MSHKQSAFSDEVRKKYRDSQLQGKYKLKTRRRGRGWQSQFNWHRLMRWALSQSMVAYLLVLSSLFLMLFYVLFLTDTFKITRVDLFEGELVSENTALQEIAAKYRGKNLMSVNRRNIIKNFTFANPRLTGLSIDRDFPNRLVIILEEAKHVANIRFKKESTQKNYIINEQGIIVRANEENSGLPSIVIESGELPIVNQNYLESEMIMSMVTAIEIFEEQLNMPIKNSYYLPTPLEVHLETERGFFVWLDLQEDVNSQIAKLKDAIPKLNIYELELEYIDLRISGATGDKIFYKPAT